MYKVIVIDKEANHLQYTNCDNITEAIAQAAWCSRGMSAAIFVGNRQIAFFKAGKQMSFRMPRLPDLCPEGKHDQSTCSDTSTIRAKTE
jgi:hypothetical protein